MKLHTFYVYWFKFQTLIKFLLKSTKKSRKWVTSKRYFNYYITSYEYEPSLFIMKICLPQASHEKIFYMTCRNNWTQLHPKHTEFCIQFTFHTSHLLYMYINTLLLVIFFSCFSFLQSICVFLFVIWNVLCICPPVPYALHSRVHIYIYKWKDWNDYTTT